MVDSEEHGDPRLGWQEDIAAALSDQTDYEHRWLIDPRTGQICFWTSDTGIDGDNPVEIDELDLIVIDSVPFHVSFQDMADFPKGISNREAVSAALGSGTAGARSHPGPTG